MQKAKHVENRYASSGPYVYSTLSRRAGGLSIGIDLSPGHCCNWRCVYCQVPYLCRGLAPTVDLEVLDRELRQALREPLRSDEPLRDIALAGHGEATTSPNFDQAVTRIINVMTELGLLNKLKLRLLTNGSLVTRPRVQHGLRLMAQANGEIWFKLDSATPAGMRHLNGTRQSVGRRDDNLRVAAHLCPTWLQSCLFAWDGMPPPDTEQLAYLRLLRRLQTEEVPLCGVQLYGPSRTIEQPEASRISLLPRSWMESFAARVEALGMTVQLIT